jgi:uroporphyrinogen III methyltransferase / synthase
VTQAEPSGSLAGLTVLVPRARGQAGGFSRLLRERGAEALEVPAIEIRPVASTAELDRAVQELVEGRYDWLVVTSVNGVAALRDRVEALRRGRGGPGDRRGGPPDDRGGPGDRRGGPPDDRGGRRTAAVVPRWIGSGRARVAAVGPATEAALRDWGVVPDLVPDVATTAALGLRFPDGPGDVLLARADRANPELGTALRAKGWRTREVVAYHTVPVGELDPATRRRLDDGEVDWVAFTASSTVEGFVRGYGGPPPDGVRVAAIGPVTAGAARAAGMRVAATATRHTIPGLVAAIERAAAPAARGE